MKYTPFYWGRSALITAKMPNQYRQLVWGCLLLVTFISTGLSAGNGQFRRAEKAFNEGDYVRAASLYAKVVEVEPTNIMANYKLGITYLELREPRKAKLYLKKTLEIDALFGQKVLVNLAEALHQNYEFEEARKYYQQEIAGLGRADRFYVELIQKRIDECLAGQAILSQPSVAQAVNMGPAINTAQQEYLPVVVDTVLLFTSQPAAGGQTHVRASGKQQGKWKNAYVFFSAGKTGQMVVGATPKADQLYTYTMLNGLEVYKRAGTKKWNEPVAEKLPLSNVAMEPSVHITTNGQFVVFASDRAGGYGGLDLYITQRLPDGTWSKALNMGPSVNTPYNEDAAFLDADTKTLYFSSQGHTTMGGYDIFKATFKDGGWQQVQNLGYPINSPHDDMYFCLASDRNTAYFTSDRPGGMGNRDIYEIIFQR